MSPKVFFASACSFSLITIAALPLQAGELLDSRELLRQLGEKKAERISATPADERRARLAALPPDEAAAEWVRWVDELLAGGSGDMFSGRGQRFSSLLEVLPGPDAWESLREQLEKGERPLGQQLHLELLAAVMTGDEARQWDLVLQLEEEATKTQGEARGGLMGSLLGMRTDYRKEARHQALGSLMDTFLLHRDDPAEIRELLMRRLKHPVSEYGDEQRSVPDLVAFFGEDGASDIIRQMFRESAVALDFSHGKATQELARAVAMEEIEAMKAAPWGLVDSVDHVELYEALKERFPRSEKDRYDYHRRHAEMYYLLGLVVQGRVQEAADLLKESESDHFYLPYGLMRDLEASSYRDALQGFLEEMLAHDPDLPLWDAYFSVAAVQYRSDSAVPFIERILAEREWEPVARWKLRQRLAEALLSADRVEDAIEMIRADAREALDDESLDPSVFSGLIETGVRMARVGSLLNESDWLEEGLQIAESSLERAGSVPSRSLVQFLEEEEMFGKAQEMVMKRLEKEVAGLEERAWGLQAARAELIDLARIYHRAGRGNDVLVLLREAPWWGVKDLAEVLEEDGCGKEPIGFIAAQALAQTGQRDEAAALLEELLLRRGGYDPAFELLVELQPENAVASFETLFELDRFEERPLIWTAVVYRGEGRLLEARQLIEKAISIDPSDGEQGPGHRMRAYQVLSDLLGDLGEEDQAAFYRDVVASIRLSEEADALYAAGLRERGIRTYREALTYFSDAYCIQARLARQLQEMGRHEEAEEHYRRAYELMPDSFGRVESHCFGCEAVFAGERAQSTAQRVFAKMREERPEQAQVWYLSGYLEYERGRYAEALEYFLKAVEIDPDYLNAWGKVRSVGHLVRLDPAVRDRAALETLRLDPLQRHVRADLSGVRNLAALWNAVEEATERQPQRRDEIFSLPAAEEFLAKPSGGRGGLGITYQTFFSSRIGRSGRFQAPAEVLARHDLLREVADSLEAWSGR